MASSHVTPVRHLAVLTSSHHQATHHGLRTFSMSRRSSAVAPRRDSGAPRQPASASDVRFTLDDVPPLSYWVEAVKSPLFSRVSNKLTSETVHDTVKAYASLAIQGAPNWRSSITHAHVTHPRPPRPPSSRSQPQSQSSESSLSPLVLHYAAVSIISQSITKSFGLAHHILPSLAFGQGQNYPPSVLTLARMGMQTRKKGMTSNRGYAEVDRIVARLAGRKDDPDACALQGMLLMAEDLSNSTASFVQKQTKEALEWFQLAQKLGGREENAFDYQPACALGMAEAYLRLGDTESAKETYGYAAEVLDLPEACWKYAIMLNEDDPKREKWMLKAAVSGLVEPAREMARIEDARLQRSMSKGSEGKMGEVSHTQDARSHRLRGWEATLSKVSKAEWEAIARGNPSSG